MNFSAENSPARFRTVLIEHETLFRTLLARIVLMSEKFLLVADFADLNSAHPACERLRPEVIVLDVDFQPEESIDFIEIIVQQRPATGVLAISSRNDPLLMHELSRVNVHGFIQRSEPVEMLEEALLEVAQRKRYWPAAFLQTGREFAQHAHEVHALSTRERLLLRKVASGLTSRLIASELNLSPRSIETYRSRLMRKLGVKNTAGLVDYAFRHGLIPSENSERRDEQSVEPSHEAITQ